MSRNRVVRPSVTRITISEGDWIEVKNELTVGEQKALEAAGLKEPIMLNGRPFQPIDWAVYELERALIFLKAWNLVGGEPEGPIPLDFSGISSLDVDSFAEINQAIIKFTVDQAAKKLARIAQTKEQEQSATSLPSESKSTEEVIST